MNTAALVGGGFGRVLGPKAADLVAVFYRLQLENVGCAAGAGAFFTGQELGCGPAAAQRQRPRGQLAARRTRSAGGRRACAVREE